MSVPSFDAAERFAAENARTLQPFEVRLLCRLLVGGLDLE
jgi:hypothetical protein